MGNIYCEYKGTRYKAKKRNNGIIITSQEKRDGFVNYIDVLGNEHTDLFMKHILFEEVDELYEEIVLVRFKGEFYELFGGKVFKDDVKNNIYTIYTNSEQLANKYLFEKKEQFVFVKDITREDIEAIKIIKKPVLKIEKKEPNEEILEGRDLNKWLEDLT